MVTLDTAEASAMFSMVAPLRPSLAVSRYATSSTAVAASSDRGRPTRRLGAASGDGSMAGTLRAEAAGGGGMGQARRGVEWGVWVPAVETGRWRVRCVLRRRRKGAWVRRVGGSNGWMHGYCHGGKWLTIY